MQPLPELRWKLHPTFIFLISNTVVSEQILKLEDKKKKTNIKRFVCKLENMR